MGWIGQAIGLGLQFQGRKKADGDAEGVGEGIDRFFVRLEIKGGDAGDGAACQARPIQGVAGQRVELA